MGEYMYYKGEMYLKYVDSAVAGLHQGNHFLE